MKKFIVSVGLVVALAIPMAALAHVALPAEKFTDYITKGAECKAHYEGAWYHFVLNKIDPAIDKELLELTVDFAPAGAGNNVTQGPTFYNNGTAHWWIFNSEALIGATTSGTTDPGERAMLVLSSYDCGKKSEMPSDD